MAKISLRVYTKEIESLIDRGQTDEAIAHCKYVLKQFPKYIDTYRLLGKAYLESRHYTEASDIFRRLLSVTPDDFVANLGMSLIKEDEDNLDSAIWHMERAFEFQPSNPAIQSELQRLRSRRDGIEPPKVRLTRGALIRMYERGELYPQAIAEIKAALAEDPKRIDLLVTLARVYYLANHKVEAIETCIRLISRLPFCFEANRILADLLPSTSRAEDALVYKQRLNTLDPYSAFLSENITTSNLVPDNAVLAERLDWQPTQSETQPQWAQSVGVTIDDQDGLPSIIEDFFEQNANNTEEPNESSITATDILETQSSLTQAPTIPENEEVIPGWMSNAGWSIANQTSAAETAVSSQEEDASGAENEISPGEIPEWLQSLVPSDSNTLLSQEDEQQNTDILESILPASESSEKKDQNVQILQDGGADVVSTPPLEENTANQVMEEAMNNTSPFESLPQDEDGLPDWLKDLTGEEKSEESQNSALLPDQEPRLDQQAAGSSEVDEAMAWLESLAARQGAGDETLTTPPELRKDTPPDWVIEAESENIQMTTAEKVLPFSEITEVDSGSQTLPMVEPEAPVSESSDLEIEETTSPPPITLEDETAFSWLESLAARQSTDEDTLIDEPESHSSTPPSWITESAGAEADSVELSMPDSADTHNEVPETHTEADQLPDELPEWLKEIEQPPVDSNELTSTLPDWLKETEAEESPEFPHKEEMQADTTADWLNESESTTPTLKSEEQSISIDELPEWLKGLDLVSEETNLNITEEVETSLEVPEVEQKTESDESQVEQVVAESAASPTQPVPPIRYIETEVPNPEKETIYIPEPRTNDSDDIENAHQQLESGQIEIALDAYNRLIEKGTSLEEVIQHLQEALYRHPVDIELWQSLGDALAKTNRLQEALDAYTKAEELLK